MYIKYNVKWQERRETERRPKCDFPQNAILKIFAILSGPSRPFCLVV